MADNVRFKEVVRHGRQIFGAGVVYGFNDANAAAYFTAVPQWAEATTDPADVELPPGSVEIETATVFASGPNKGQPVIGG